MLLHLHHIIPWKTADSLAVFLSRLPFPAFINFSKLLFIVYSVISFPRVTGNFFYFIFIFMAIFTFCLASDHPVFRTIVTVEELQ